MALHLVPRVLSYVEAVAAHGSIQAASREIGIAASAIDRQVKLLEDRLGALLFDRMPTGMSLTPVGEMFVLMARRWSAEENRIWSDVKQMQGVEIGRVRLVTMDSLVNGVVPQFLARVTQSHPGVQVDVEIATPDDAVAALDDGRADVALAFNLPRQRDVQVLWSAELPLVCVMRPDHPLAGAEKLTLNEVHEHPIVVQSRALAIRRIIEARHGWILSGGPPPLTTNSLQLLKQVVLEGRHLALTSALDTSSEVLAGTLVAIPVTGPSVSPQSISLAVSSRRVLSRLGRTLAELLRQDVAGLMERLARREG